MESVGEGDEIVPDGALVVEGVDGSSYSLVDEEIIEVFGASFSVDSGEPGSTKYNKKNPCRPTPSSGP